MIKKVWTAEDAVAAIREQHTPYIPEVVAVSEDGETWRDPTIEDRLESLEWWCDGCNRPAERCEVMPIIDLIGMEI